MHTKTKDGVLLLNIILVLAGENFPCFIELQLQDKLDWVLSNNATFCKEAFGKKIVAQVTK